jgi:hypothetical protein
MYIIKQNYMYTITLDTLYADLLVAVGETSYGMQE